MITFKEVSKIFEGTAGDTQHQALAIETAGLLARWEGWLPSLVPNFEQNGLGHIIASWVSTGNNPSISEDQVTRVMRGRCVIGFGQKGRD